MDVYINGEFVATVNANAREAVTVAQRHLPPGFGFGRIWIDGTAYAGVEALEEIGNVMCQRLDLEALSVGELADQVASSVLAYVARLIPFVEDLAWSLRFNESAPLQRLEVLASAIEYVEMAQKGVAAADRLQGRKDEGIEAQRLVEHLEDVIRALEQGDTVGAADILEYVMCPVLRMIEARMRARVGATGV
mgnify:CR=1 FL=1